MTYLAFIEDNQNIAVGDLHRVWHPTLGHLVCYSWCKISLTQLRFSGKTERCFSRILISRMRLVGLTGGIASGKSTVSREFHSHGLPVVDADKVAHAALRKGTGGWKKVVATFGQDILLENREVDRARLGQIVFADPEKRQLLNRALAPYIGFGIYWEIVKHWLKGSETIVLDVPLLFEAKMNWLTKPIMVVWVDPATQLQRLIARDGISEEQALNRINSQMPLDLKRDKADIVIDNSGSLEATKDQIHDVLLKITGPLTWKEYMRSRRGVLTVTGAIAFVILVLTRRPSIGF